MHKFLSPIIASALLAGCTSIPLSSISKLSQLSPDTIPFERVQIAVQVPEDYRLYRDGATLKSTTSGPSFEEPRSINLQMIPSAIESTPFLAQQQKSGFRIAVFEVNPEDVAVIHQYSEDVARMVDENPGQNSIVMTGWATGCLAKGANPFQDLRMALFIRPDPTEEFFTLFKRTKIGNIEDGTDGSVCADADEPNLIW